MFTNLIKSFYSLLKIIANDLKPSQHHVLLQYLSAFDGDLGYYLTNRRTTTLAQARDNAIELEEVLSRQKEIEPL